MLVGLATLTASSSCVDAQELLIVENALWWSDDCVLSASDAPPASMTLDVYFNSPYGLGFAVTNNRVVNAGSNSGLDDTEMVLDYAEVNLSFSGGSLATSSFEYQLPSQSLYGGDSFPILVELPKEVIDSLSTTMAALPEGTHETLNMEVIVHARTTGSPGSNARLGAYEARPFIFPLQICYGCLSTCQLAEDCGGEGNTLICPGPDDYIARCGYAQFGAVVHPTCDFPD